MWLHLYIDTATLLVTLSWFLTENPTSFIQVYLLNLAVSICGHFLKSLFLVAILLHTQLLKASTWLVCSRRQDNETFFFLSWVNSLLNIEWVYGGIKEARKLVAANGCNNILFWNRIAHFSRVSLHFSLYCTVISSTPLNLFYLSIFLSNLTVYSWNPPQPSPR